MFLYNLQRITRDIKIKDETKKEVEALKVFQFAIQYLKEHLYKSIADKIKGIQEHDLHYVLTVPAIWEDSAKQFMREAATKVCNLILSYAFHYSILVSSFVFGWKSYHPLATITVVKELRSKMFGQHPGYFKAVFLKQTRIIIVSIYKYTVYIMF